MGAPEAVWAVLPLFCTRVVSFLFQNLCTASGAPVRSVDTPGVPGTERGAAVGQLWDGVSRLQRPPRCLLLCE